jgi:hypothetical protein
MDPDPGGPKTCRSGSGTLIERSEQQTYITQVAKASSGLELEGEVMMGYCAFSQLTKLSVSDTGKCTVDTKVENIEGWPGRS